MFGKIIDFIWGHIPHRLPIYEEEVAPFCNDIIEAYNLPDDRSYVRRLCETIIQTRQDRDWIRPKTLKIAIHRYMAQQVAYNLANTIRLEEKAEEDKQKQAATPPQEPPSEPTKQGV